jgi:hypothetical protein
MHGDVMGKILGTLDQGIQPLGRRIFFDQLFPD